MHLWRISRAIFAGSAFTGEGARLFGGRWNDPGTRVVYTATSLALASVEYFVNIEPGIAPDDLIISEAILPSNMPLKTLDLSSFADSENKPNLSLTRRIGHEWLKERQFAAFKVPSFAVEGDWNVLLNPEHPDFTEIEVLPDKPWRFDPRMSR